MKQTTFAVALVIVLAALAGGGVAAAKGGPGHGKGKGKKPGTPGVTIFASGFNNPRGLTFGPGGNLYVAEGGLGGTHSSAADPCPQAHGMAAPYFGSTNDPVLGGRISKIDKHGHVSTVADALPSSQTSRVVDISAQVGHVVPTAILPLGPKGMHHGKGHKSHKHPGRFVIANLGVFGPGDGTTPNESVWTINAMGHLTQSATGLEQVLGLAFRGHALYALEMSTTPGGPTPGSGAIVQVGPSGPVKTVGSGLIFPTGMTVGKDGAFYVSEQGFGFGAGDGRVLRITTH